MRLAYRLVYLPLALLAGCATHAVDNNYGNAYQRMLDEQVYDPATRNAALGDRAIESTDPELAELALTNMRKDSSSRQVSTAGAVVIAPGGMAGGGGSGGGSQ